MDTLRSVSALPVEIVGEFREPLGFERVASGQELVFDRRGHAVYAVTSGRTGSRKLVAIGGEDGRVIEPTAFDAEPGGTFVVADAPNGRERVQIFTLDGRRAGGFTLPGRATPRVTLGSLSLSGVGTLQYTGRSVLISQPETGGLMTEYGLAGTPVRTIGGLRATGHEPDRELHLALNAGIPLKDADGGYWFVFLAGQPAFSRFSADGALLFHRLIQGRELDPVVASLPVAWPRRAIDGTEVPLVSPTIRTAALALGRYDIAGVMTFYAAMQAVLIWVGILSGLGAAYFAGLAVAAVMMGYHWFLIRARSRDRCFRAFMHNNWVGAAIFAGIVFSYPVPRFW